MIDQAETAPGTRQVHGIDLLRFAAASLVMLYHFTYVPWADPMLRGTHEAAAFGVFRPLGQALSAGWVGVPIFFVISGYVIAYSAEGKRAIAFLNSRLLRLLPGVWICATLSLPFLATGGEAAPAIAARWLGSAVMWPTGPWTANAFWTLPLEVAFYALVFVLIGAGRVTQLWRLALVLGGASTILWLAFWTRHSLPHPIETLVFTLADRRIGQLLLLQHGCFFAIGMLIRLAQSGRLPLSHVLALTAFGVTGVAQLVAEARRASVWAGTADPTIAVVTLWLVALAVLAVSVGCRDAIGRRIGASAATIRAIGLATFPMYLLHQPIGNAVIPALIAAGVPPYAALAVTVAAVVALSFVVAMRLEPPLRRSLRRGLERAESALTRPAVKAM